MKYPLLSRIFFFLSCGLFLIALSLRALFSTWDFTALFYLFSFFICFFLSIVLDLRGYYNLLTLKSTKRGLTYLSGIVLMLVIFISINYAMTYVSWKRDVSDGAVYTISDFSKSVAKSFNEPVEFIYLQVPTANSKNIDEKIKGAIRLYIDENPRFTFKKWNLFQHPELVQEYKLNDQESALFVQNKERRERFYMTDENGITQSLLRLLKGRKTIYFSVGHGEQTIGNDKARGLSGLKKEVERLFYDAQEIHLESEVIPQDAAGVIVIGPEKELSVRVQEKLIEYFNKGGRLFLAFDPLNDIKANLFLKYFGLGLENGIVHQEQSALAHLGSHIVTGLIADQSHKVLEGMESTSPVMFYVSGSLKTLSQKETIKVILQSPKTAMLRDGFTKQDRVIREGPFDLLVLVSGKEGGEAFVAADSDLFANQFLYQHANPLLMFNMFSYLSKDEDIIGKKIIADNPQFLITDFQLKIYIGLFIIPLPILLFSAGAFLWFRRRWL